MASEPEMETTGWDEYNAMSPSEKGRFFLKDGRTYHVLNSQQFDRATLDSLCELATMTRRISKARAGALFIQDLLCEKRAMLYFSQPSTRTFLSFYAACQIVGLRPGEVRDTSTSSELKGESPEDTIRTFSSYFDVIIMRHPKGGFAERIAWMLSQSYRTIPVINAGSGKDQHPTQALLDIYTLHRSFDSAGGIENRNVAFVGDLARGRTVRSLAQLLTLYPGGKQYFVAPDSLQIGQDILDALDAAGVDYEVTADFEGTLPKVDAVYMTRIQDEWDAAHESKDIDTSAFKFGDRHLSLLRKDAIIMHPLPRRDEIAVEVDKDPRAIYWRQVRNGMWVRAALLLSIFGVEGEVEKYYAQHGEQA
jgi:aspartate carbamoyltransferase catalytic subunit